MLYDIKGFRKDGSGWHPTPVDGGTIPDHIKQECSRLTLKDRSELDAIRATADVSQVDVSAGESATVTLTYTERQLDPDNSTIQDVVATSETGDIDVVIEDPDGQTSSQTFSPTDGEASFSITPDKTGVWTIRADNQETDYLDGFVTIEGV